MAEVTELTQQATLPLRWRAASVAAVMLALGALVWTLAHWGWHWFGPAPVAFPAPLPDGDLPRKVADAKLFGTAAPASQPVAGATDLGDLRLLGVFAQTGGNGYALFRSASRGAILIQSGQDVSQGLRLTEVRPDGVTVVGESGSRDLTLRPIAGAEKPKPTVVATAGKSAACNAPAGFRGVVIRLNAELLSGMIATPDAWKALVAPASGALVVRDQSGFAGMLGLKNGDRIEKANGIALAIPDDIGPTILQPLIRSQQVWLAGVRDGKPQQWLYVNTGACAA